MHTEKKFTVKSNRLKKHYSSRRMNSARVREPVTAGGRRFQDEAARYENARRDMDRRQPGGCNMPACVARVVRCDTVARATNNERIASGVCGSLSAPKTRTQSRHLTRSSMRASPVPPGRARCGPEHEPPTRPWPRNSPLSALSACDTQQPRPRRRGSIGYMEIRGTG